jgi:hypothetical protein
VEASGAARTLWENSGLLASKRKWEKKFRSNFFLLPADKRPAKEKKRKFGTGR